MKYCDYKYITNCNRFQVKIAAQFKIKNILRTILPLKTAQSRAKKCEICKIINKISKSTVKRIVRRIFE